MTCDHPECSDGEHKTYSDEHDNELALCEAHYYWLVSGDRPSTLRPDRTPGFAPPRREAILDEAQSKTVQPEDVGIDIPDPEFETVRRKR